MYARLKGSVSVTVVVIGRPTVRSGVSAWKHGGNRNPAASPEWSRTEWREGTRCMY